MDAQTIRPQRRIGPVTLEVTGRAGAVDQMRGAIRGRTRQIFAFCNMHTFNCAERSDEFAAALSRMTVFNDGIGIEFASRLLFGEGFPANLNGTDLTPALLDVLDPGTSVFFLGSSPGVAQEAALRLAERHPGIRIAGARDGFFDDEEAAPIAEAIRESGAELVLVGMGHPRQELWAAAYGRATGGVTLCIGAFLDFSAGRVTRAPAMIRAIRMEWAWRMALEPRRMIRRYLGGAVPFLKSVLGERRARRGLTRP